MASQSVLKWGNSLAFRIPAGVAKELRVREGETVTYRIVGKQLIVEKSREEILPAFTHADLVKALKKARKTSLVDFGPPRGKEAF